MYVNLETLFFVVLVFTAAVIFVKGLKRRRQLQQRWHERPPRHTYKPPLDETEDVYQREYRRPL